MTRFNNKRFKNPLKKIRIFRFLSLKIGKYAIQQPDFKLRTDKDTMSKAVENLLRAQQRALSIRPKQGGFPYLAEVLKRAGVTKNIWSLPSCQSIYLTQCGPVVIQGAPLLSAPSDIPLFNRDALIAAIKIDQAGHSSFPEFLKSCWESGVVSYVVDFEKRLVVYYGVLGESYSENYPTIEME